jgi:methyltransferase-like protein
VKLKTGFITHQVGKEQMMVAAGPAAKLFHGMVRSNETAAFIIDCLKKDTTESAIVDAMAERYEAPRATIEQDVHNIIEKLKEIGALE